MINNYEYLDENMVDIDVTNNDDSIRADVDVSMSRSPQARDYDGCHGFKKDCEHIEGNVIEVDVKKDDCEIRADIKVDRRRTVRLWGQVKDCDKKPVKCALVKLVKVTYKHGKVEIEGVAHTVTDCMGFYQFDICTPKKEEKFKVIISKPAIGKEREIKREKCDPCKKDCDCI